MLNNNNTDSKSQEYGANAHAPNGATTKTMGKRPHITPKENPKRVEGKAFNIKHGTKFQPNESKALDNNEARPSLTSKSKRSQQK